MSRLVSELGADVIDDTQTTKKRRIDPRKRNYIVGFSVLSLLAILLGFVYYIAINVWLYDYQNMPYIQYSVNATPDTEGPYAGKVTASIDRVLPSSNYPSYFKVPEKIQGHYITTIRDQAFAGCERLTGVYMKNNIRSLGDEVFLNCEKLKTITFSKNIYEIGNNCFEGTLFQENFSNYEYYVVNNILLYVNEDRLLNDSNKSKIALVSSKDSTYAQSFDNDTLVYSLSELSPVNSPKETLNLTTWMNGLFSNFESLVFVETPSYLSEITINAFANSYNLERAVISGDKIGNGAFRGCAALSDVSIATSITSIGNFAFASTSLSTVNLHEGLTFLGEGVFSGCSNITTINIPSSVTALPVSFLENTSLETITFTNADRITSIGAYAFYNTNLTSFVLPKNVDTIADYTFAECDSLTDISVYDNNLVRIDAYSFYMDENFNSMSLLNDDGDVIYSEEGTLFLPSSLEYTDKSVGIDTGHNFEKTAIRKVVFQPRIKNISRYMFASCTQLSEVVWSSIYETRCRTVGQAAFENCSAITEFTMPNLVRTIGLYAFRNCTNLVSIHLPEANAWTAFERNIATNYGSTQPLYFNTLNEHLFNGCTSLSSLILPSTTTRIASYALANCTSLHFLHIPSTINSIGANAFDGSSNLYLSLNTSIVPDSSRFSNGWNNGVKGYALGSEDIFEEDGLVYSLNKDLRTLTVIDINNKDISSLVIPNTVRGFDVSSIGDNFLNTSETLTSVTLPSNLTSFGNNAFANCPNLSYTEENGFFYLGSSSNPHLALVKSDYSNYEAGEDPSFILNDNVKVISSPALANPKINFFIEEDASARYLSTSTNNRFALVSASNSLTQFSVNEDTKLIVGNAFSMNATIRTVIIPDSVEHVMKAAFISNRNINIYCKHNNKPAGWDFDWNISASPSYWKTLGPCNTDQYNACINLDGSARLLSYKGGLKTITLPNTLDTREVKEIASGFMVGDSSITSITIPSSVTVIGENAFSNLLRATIYAEAGSKPAGWDNNWNPDDIPTYFGITSENHHVIAGIDYVLDGNNAIVSGYQSLAHRAVLNSTISIGDDTYNVTAIGNKAFAGSNLTYVVIPSSVTTIGSSAFADCPKAVIYAEANEAQPGWAEDFNPNNRPIYYGIMANEVVLDNSLVFHKTTSQSGPYAVVSAHLEGITEANIPNTISIGGSELSVKAIGQRAFEGANDLTYVNFTKDTNVESIGSYAFARTTSLVWMVIPSSVKTMGERVFYLGKSSFVAYVESETIPSGWNEDWNIYEAFNSSEEDENDYIIYYVGLDIEWEYSKENGLPTPIE